MANNTYVLLSKATVGAAGASSITFSNIPQTGYTDLVIKASARSTKNTTVWDGIVATFNGSTANFNYRSVNGDGSTAYSLAAANNNIGPLQGDTGTANTFSNYELYLPNYTSSNYKSMSIDAVVENNATEGYDTLHASLWSNTAAITTITLTPSSGSNFKQYSDFYLYGISNVNTTPTVAPFATGGDIITNDGTYWYHAFLSSGTFTPAKTLTCSVLAVAGGGGGGAGQGGGGGAGGLLAFTNQSLSATAYTITVGAGGAGGTRSSATNGKRGTTGSDSQFGALTLVKGGGGGGNYDDGGAGLNGGSGGGAGCVPGLASGGTATSGQGNNGGNVTSYTSLYYGGGGGGAGAVGNNGGNLTGTGGVGSSAYSSWGLATNTGQNVAGTVYYAGGGGGAGDTAGSTASGGYGGGASSANGTPTGATANTGGGGGGSTYTAPTTAAGAGGSGIVIVRYAMA